MPDQTPVVGMERKLAAIFSTDVAGYSRLMGDDEAATIRTLTTYREVMTSLIQQHRGRVVDSPGDNLLAEFASAVDAVQGAVEIQHELQKRNVELPDKRKMQYRIGINVGDVIIEGERLYGDGVNIAARLEGLAEPGGICISGTVYDQVENKLALNYTYVGEQEVKNIAKPVRVYRLGLEVPSPLVGEGQSEGAARKAESSRVQGPGSKPRRVRPAHRWVVVGLLLIAVTIAAVRYFSVPPSSTQSPSPSPQPSLSPQSSALITQEAPSLLLPDRPSLIVLPFVNMSKEPDQEYFSDGLTEILTGDLSKISSLFVIARNSAFTYKGKAVKVQDVGREMGVRYVLEGSVQKADQRVRIAAQLIEATTGYHLWSEQYDRPLIDIFALQDEIVQQIIANLQVKVFAAELARVRHIPTDNLTAYDCLLRGMEYGERVTKEANLQARQMFERSIELDTDYATAYAHLGQTYLREWDYFWTADPNTLDQALALAQRAVELDDSLPLAHSVLGSVYLWKKQHDRAFTEAERASALDPNNPDIAVELAETVLFAGERSYEAHKLVETAMRLNPHYPDSYLLVLGRAYPIGGKWEEEANAVFKKLVARNPDFLLAHVNLVASYIWLGREEAARAEAAEVLRIDPQFSIEQWQQTRPFRIPAVALNRMASALRQAGLK